MANGSATKAQILMVSCCVHIFCLVSSLTTTTTTPTDVTTTSSVKSPASHSMSVDVNSTTASTSSIATTTTTTTPTTLPSLSKISLWQYLPREWSSICTVDYTSDPEVHAKISCHIPPDDQPQWRLADLRTALAPLEKNLGLAVAVSLQCDDGGTVSIPFPYRAPGMVRLTVRNCIILDKYADFMTPAQNLPDSLKHLFMENCTWMTHRDAYFIVMNNIENLTSHYDCGQDSTMVTYIYRNIRDAFFGETPVPPAGPGGSELPLPKELLGGLNITAELQALINSLSVSTPLPTTKRSGSEGLPDEALKTLIDLDQASNDIKCSFQNLEVQDESNMFLSSRSHFEFLAKNSRYPKLRLLNYTRFGILEVPQEFREARRKFPGSQLGVIDISYNNISKVGFIPGYSSKGINLTLIMRHNNISYIDYDLFQTLALVPDFYVDIRDNPIECNCDMKDLLTDLQDDSKWNGTAMTYYRNELSFIRCATPLELEGRSIASLTVVDLACPVYGADLMPAMAGLAVVVVVLLISLIVAIRYRKEARILMYTRMHVVLPCGLPMKTGAPTSEKDYDAFVAYAHQDSDWVLNSMMKRLEEPQNAGRAVRPCKLCIHQRDFVVGKPIIDNIIDSIAASRHTIIVLSKNFVKSNWAMEELQHAYRQSMEERRCHLVLVVLEEVPLNDMTPVLRRCTKTFTYINVNDALFWDRLLYSIHVADMMPTKKRTKSATDTDDYDDISPDAIQPVKADDRDVEKGEKGEVIQMEDDNQFDTEFRRALFLESMRTMSVDTTYSTVSDTHIPPTPNQFHSDRPLFSVTR